MKKKLINILTLSILIIFICIIAIFPVDCIFTQFTGIYCPGCGLTRAFNEIIHFNFVKAFYFNILSIPLFIFFIILIINLLIDIIKNRYNFIPKLINFFAKYYLIIIILLILSFIYNNLILK